MEANISENYDNRATGETRKGNWMQTFSGVQFWPLDARAVEISIIDIGHALSNLCRYAGHCKEFYSVAEHSVLVSHQVEPELQLQALLHDATEAYLVDIPRPIKKYIGGYHEMEDALWKVIAQTFGVPEEMHKSIKLADNAVLLAEADQVLGPRPAPWEVEGTPADITVEFLPPSEAKSLFLNRFVELVNRDNGGVL